MSIRVVSDTSRVDDILRQVDDLSRLTLQVGIFSEAGGDILLRANVHEFGSAVRGIPERSFMRAGLKAHESDIENEANNIIDDVIAGDTTARIGLELLGQKIVDWIVDYLRGMSSPALKAATIEAKGSSSLLQDTGQLRDSITYKVV